MKRKTTIEKCIRGWFPKEPTLPGKYTPNQPEKQMTLQPSNKRSRFWRGIISVILLIAFGIYSLIYGQPAIGAISIAFAPAFFIILYWEKKKHTLIVASTLVGMLLISTGMVTFFYGEIAITVFASVLVLTLALLTIGSMFLFWIIIAVVIGIVWLVRVQGRNKEALRRQLSKRRLEPYGVAALFIFLTYIAVISGIQVVYAISITFIISGLLMLKGLRHFAMTIPSTCSASHQHVNLRLCRRWNIYGYLCLRKPLPH